MVTLRGKKANAKPKVTPAEKADLKKQAKAAAVISSVPPMISTQNITATASSVHTKEEQMEEFLRFFVHSTLMLNKLPFNYPISSFCDSLLTAFCTGKDKSSTPSQIISKLSRTKRKRICRAIFSEEGIAYSCRTCQMDSTCVICRDCFTNSDHTGHDVYFQRTTAGSSCDCGDPQAWKPSGYCSQHPGADRAEVKGARRQQLPKSIATTAPVIIEAVVAHVFELLMTIDFGFELSKALDMLTKDLSPSILSKLPQDEEKVLKSEGDIVQRGHSSAVGASQMLGQLTTPSSMRQNMRNTRHAKVAEQKTTPTLVSDGLPRQCVNFAIQYHYDDRLGVERTIESILGCTVGEARNAVHVAKQEGSVELKKMPLLANAVAVGKLVRASLSVSIVPVWQKKQMENLPALLEWLQSISSSSDELSNLVSNALQNDRVTCYQSYTSNFKNVLDGDTTVISFFKSRNIRLHRSSTHLLESVVGADISLLQWVSETEQEMDAMFHFHSTFVSIPSNVKPLQYQEKTVCQNIFVEELVKAACHSPLYSQHQSFRDSCNSVIEFFFKKAVDSIPKASVLRYLVLHDCILPTRAAELSHGVIREHLLDVSFGRKMLEVYISSYYEMTSAFLGGRGGTRDSIFDFAVQFLTVPDLVKGYTSSNNSPPLVSEFLETLYYVLSSVSDPNTGTLSVEHPALMSQKYKPCIDNLSYVLNASCLPNDIICKFDNLKLWLRCLGTFQNADIQTRRGTSEDHVEYESNSWLAVFNLGLHVHSIFSVSLNSFTPEVLIEQDMQLSRILSRVFNAVILSSTNVNSSLTKKILHPIARLSGKQNSEFDEPFESYVFNVAAQPISLHLPLHRYLSAILRHVTILNSNFAASIAMEGLLVAIGVNKVSQRDICELIELPLRCLCVAAQIHSNLWRRNDDENMTAQLYNYSAVPFSIHYRDADLFLLQLGIITLGPERVLASIVDRFQVASFLINPESHVSSLKTLEELGYTPLENGIDDQQMLSMVEECMRLVITLGTVIPSSTGSEYEDEYLKEEMLQHLCAKSYPFSKLLDIAVLPNGDDVPIPRLEGILNQVADFKPPDGLSPGRYELKAGFLEHYNPYFLHLSHREANELARVQWTQYRQSQRAKAKLQGEAYQPPVPLKAMAAPLAYLQPARNILTCEGTIVLVHAVLWRIMRTATSNSTDSKATISDGLASTSLHLLVYGVHAAIEMRIDTFWSHLCERKRMFALPIVELLYQILQSSIPLLDEEQTGTVEWLIWASRRYSKKCHDLLLRVEGKSESRQERGKSKLKEQDPPQINTSSHTLTLEERRKAARERVMAAMAERQASFAATNPEGSEKEDSDDSNNHDSEEEKEEYNPMDIANIRRNFQSPYKRMSSIGQSHTGNKRRKLNGYEEIGCLLCHDTTKQEEMGMAAYVHQSTVLASGFRPEPDQALTSEGSSIRLNVQRVIDRMNLCPSITYQPSQPITNVFPSQRAHPALIDWSLPNPANAIEGAFNQGRGGRRRHGRMSVDGILMGNHILPTDEEFAMLEGVLGFPDDADTPSITSQLRDAGFAGNDQATTPPRTRLVFPDRPGQRDRMAAADRTFLMLANDSEDDDDYHDAHFHFRRSQSVLRESEKLHLTPCGLHLRTCQHTVHVRCLEQYIRTLHDKAIRGEDYDGAQATDPESAMTQFLCPLCKTLSNILIPIAVPVSESAVNQKIITNQHSWYYTLEQQLQSPGWWRAVYGRDTRLSPGQGANNTHELWRDYFEETLWEPHGCLEKSAPYLWASCSFSVASFLVAVEKEHEHKFNTKSSFDVLVDEFPPSLEMEWMSLVAVVKFCRWSFMLLEHSEDANVIWETAKRCCPLTCESKREYKKFTNVLGAIEVCLRGTVLGLLVADTFTAFVISSVIADSVLRVQTFIPIFAVADILQRTYIEFFRQEGKDAEALFQDINANFENPPADEVKPRTINTRSSKQTNVQLKSKVEPVAEKILEDFRRKTTLNDEEDGILQLLLHILEVDSFNSPGSGSSNLKLKPLSREHLRTRIKRIKKANETLVSRMKLFWRCLDGSSSSSQYLMSPSISSIASSPKSVLDQIWKWCLDRMSNKLHFGIVKPKVMCEHMESGSGEAYFANMFILRDTVSNPSLIALPERYDELYSRLAGTRCSSCSSRPSDPAICLVCGQFLCCGDDCCTRPLVPNGSPMGECTRHAAACGGGVGVFLLLEQCRIAIIGGNMAAHFPSPYVDEHGEEDVGLQRGRPLKLDSIRYGHLQMLWVTHKLHAEVSRQRNQRDPQLTINLSTY